MKKLLMILSLFFFAFALHAQQTEDEVNIGLYKGKTFGRYTGPSITIPDADLAEKKSSGLRLVTGVVTNITLCEGGCMVLSVKRDDSTIVNIGTKDFGFKVPKNILGHRISVEGVTPEYVISDRKRREGPKNYQRDIQFAATGILVID